MVTGFGIKLKNANFRLGLLFLVFILILFAPTSWLYLPVNILGTLFFILLRGIVYIGVLLVNSIISGGSYIIIGMIWLIVEILRFIINVPIVVIRSAIDLINSFSPIPIPKPSLISNPISLSWAITSLLGDPNTVSSGFTWSWIPGSSQSLFEMLT